jgi:drug/metabolite transporter (DMT)-like permease
MPYLYAQIAFATLAGWLVFGHRPDFWTVMGIALIVLCGIVGVKVRQHASRA